MPMELLIPISIILSFLIMSFFLLQGKGAFLIAGFNTMPAAEKAKYDKVALCKATGKLLLMITFLTALITAADFLGLDWLMYAAIGSMFAVIILALIYMNTGNRYKRTRE
ncbi:MAG TPA: DUF3784 domain-containing protein [Planococcus sp. (in: firmicutes)]|nr:DUF3784 domain-containing protein [Planococcus sp. (in: firmicutes)]